MNIFRRRNKASQQTRDERTFMARSYYASKLQSGEKGKEAFKLALQLRAFEIELYWKRTAYFWAFILIAFTGFVTVMSVDSYGFDNELWMLAVSSFGLVVSLAWVLVNKGSKYWQENWENHIDQLEDDFVGPLYKTILESPQKRCDIINPFVPGPYSVSRINQIISVYVFLMWVILFFYSSLVIEIFCWPPSLRIEYFFFALTIIAIVYLLFLGKSRSTWTGKSEPGSHPLVIRPRKSNISDYKES